MARPVLSLAKDVTRAVRAGHPWVFDRALHPPARPLRPGGLVEVAYRGQSLAVGFADPDSPIAVRLLDRDPRADVGFLWARGRAERAAEGKTSVQRAAACGQPQTEQERRREQ